MNMLIQGLKITLKVKFFYIRMSLLSHYSALSCIKLREMYWNRTLCPMTSEMSMILKLSQGQAIEESMSSNWKHNFKRGLKRNIKIERWLTPNVNEMYTIYNEMEILKSLNEQFSKQELISIISEFSDKLVVFKALNSKNELIGFRGCLIFGNIALDFLAAVNEEARKVYCSHLLLHTLIKFCSQAGIIQYDMGGVDPIKALGVYNFKRGIGAKEVEYMGEWEKATFNILKVFINYYIRKMS